MTRRWDKLGRIYTSKTNERHPKLISHAANPLPILISGDIYRIFFSGRDSKNRSSVGAVDIDIAQKKIIEEHHAPFFEHGPKGSFYEDGVSIGGTYVINNTRYMLFMGWQNPDNDHWRGDIGRLIITPDLKLEIDSNQPLLASDINDPISLSYPCVHQKTSGVFNMWYGSTITWNSGNGEMLHVIKHAESEDGHVWRRTGKTIPFELGVAQAFSKPSVIELKNGTLGMWFSYRGDSVCKYRIGLATSDNGRDWNLDLENVGIDVSKTGWDSEMIAYPSVFYHKDRIYMLYNGNNYGESGFGLAVFNE